MNISSKLKKIISFMLVTMLVMSAVVLPVSAEETTEEEITESEYNVWDDLSDAPTYNVDDINYTGEHSKDVNTEFNIRKEFGLNWCLCDYYMSRPFKFFYNWDSQYDTTYYRLYSFAEDAKQYASMFDRDTFDSGFNQYVESYGISLDDYDIYYTFYYRNNRYGNLVLKYYCVPKGMHIAFSNQGLKKDEPNNYNNVKYGVKYPRDNTNVYTIEIYINGENKTLSGVGTNYLANPEFEAYTGREHARLIATNMPVFNLYSDAVLWANTGSATHNPSNSAPQEPEEEKVGADAFYWDSLKCRIVESGDSYKLVFDYSYSAKDMVNNSSSYQLNVDMTQSAKYKVSGDNNIYTYTNKDYHSSLNIGTSPGSVVDQASMLNFQTWGTGGSILRWGLQAWSDFWGTDRDWTAVNFINSYIYVYVELVHVQPGGNGLLVKDKVSSDVRTFKFDALTLESLDEPEEIKSDVTVKDTKNENGKVIDRTVSQVVTNDNSTHQTINNYYYDSNGNKSNSSTGSSALSDILSTLIQFIKTLVTEGLPAALEILKTLVSSLTGIVSDALNNIDIGTGTTNGILAIFKAFPAAMWSLLLIGMVVLLIVGIVNRIL